MVEQHKETRSIAKDVSPHHFDYFITIIPFPEIVFPQTSTEHYVVLLASAIGSLFPD